MKQQRSGSLHARKIGWSLVTTTRGLSPVWVSVKVYDAVAKRLMKGARGRYGMKLLKSRSAPLRLDLNLMRRPGRKTSATNQDNCTYVVIPELITNIRGLAQVWIRASAYDAVAGSLIRVEEGKYTRQLLRQRIGPLGVDYKCQGSCYGGWCNEALLQPDELSALYVCECAYFV
jgi:hypothetical protein